MAMYVSGRRDEHQSSSEEVEISNCDHCRATGQSVSATRYCPTCDECLCPSCSLMHTGAKLTKHHTLTDIPTSSKDGQSTIPVPKWQDCPEHKGEAIRLFCTSHNALCCVICLYKLHKSCTNTTLIADLATDFKESEEFKSFKADLGKIEREKSAQEKLLKLNEKKIEPEYCKALKEINSIADMAHLRIDKLKENTIEKATEIKKENAIKLKQMGEIFKRLESDIKFILRDIEEEEATLQPERLNIAWKISQSKLERVKSDTSKLKMYYIKSLRLECTEEIDTLLNANSVLGTFSEKQLTMKYVGEINVKSPSDQKDCGINGIALLSPEQMIVTDWINKNIKYIDIKENTIVQTRVCSETPFDVTLLNNNKIGVTLTEDKTIRVLSADANLAMDHDIKVDGGCLSVVQEHHHGHLLVLYRKTVKVLSMTGTVIREFSTDSSGEQLFECARYIALSPDHRLVYVSDNENHTVTCLTLDGDVISVYRDVQLWNPRGIVVDDDGHVFVGSGYKHNIHILSWDCLKQKIFPIDQNMMKFPSAFAFCPTMNILYMSSAHPEPSNRNFIKMFKLQQILPQVL